MEHVKQQEQIPTGKPKKPVVTQKMGVKTYTDIIPEGYISFIEFRARLGISKATFAYHKKMNVFGSENMVVVDKNVRGSFTMAKGVYINWQVVGDSIYKAFSSTKKRQVSKHLKHLGFGVNLHPLDTEIGVIRLSNSDAKTYESALQLDGDATPHSLGLGWLCEEWTGVAFNGNKVMKGSEQPKLWRDLDAQNAIRNESVDGSSGDTDSDTYNSEDTLGDIRNIDEDAFLNLLESINYSDPEDVERALAITKVRTEYMKARKTSLEVAKLSNSVVDADDIEKLLGAAMTAIRSTIDQAAVKIGEEVVGNIITQIAMHDPKLQRVAKYVDNAKVVTRLREAFDRSLFELSDILDAFSRSIDEGE